MKTKVRRNKKRVYHNTPAEPVQNEKRSLGRQGHLPSQFVELFQIVIDFSFGVKLCVVGFPQIDKGLIVFQHVINSDQHAVRNRYGCSVFAASGSDSIKLSLEE